MGVSGMEKEQRTECARCGKEMPWCREVFKRGEPICEECEEKEEGEQQ